MTSLEDKMNAINCKQQEIDENRNELTLMQQSAELQMQLQALEKKIKDFMKREMDMRQVAEDPKIDERKRSRAAKDALLLAEEIKLLERNKGEIQQLLITLDYVVKDRVFDKYRIFSNIRELLKDSEIKIGAIEKEAGCQPGYMSRLDKPGNTSEPSVAFLVTAAKLLNVSLDMLVSLDLSVLSTTEKYLLSFVEKLQKDTVAGKLEWEKETAVELNNLEPEMDAYVPHPLFDFYACSDENHPGVLKSRICMYSDTFKENTSIYGDCFNITLKDGARLYLMDICKSVRVTGNINFCAKEIWMHKPREGSSCLMTDKNPEYGDYVKILFEVVGAYMRRPQIKKAFKSVIDAFMLEDFSDDEMPFN